MTTAASAQQLLLLADHVKLSLLERQRAASLGLDADEGGGREAARSLEALRRGLDDLESQPAPAADTTLAIARLNAQHDDLYAQLHGEAPPTRLTTTPNDPALRRDFAAAARGPRSKSVRFRDDPAAEEEEDAEHAANRAALLPYSDEPEAGDVPDQAHLDNVQIHEHHARALREQDEQLDRLGESVGRTRHLSIQIGSELDEQVELLDDVDGHVDRHTTALERAKGRLGKVARKAKDNIQLTVIFILIIILVLLIVILE